VGLTERSKENAQKARKIRDDARDRERMEREKLAAQWAKMDQNLSFAFTPADEASAVDKLATASFKYDPNNPGPMGMTAFTCKTMPPAIFREMVKRSFNVRLTDPELAAMVRPLLVCSCVCTVCFIRFFASLRSFRAGDHV